MRRSGADDRTTGLPDDQLVELAVAADAAAIAELYRRYFRFARSLAQLSDRDGADPAALIAESFRRAFDALRSSGRPRPEFRGVLSAAILAVAGASVVPSPREPRSGGRSDRQNRLRWVLAQMPLQERRSLWHEEVEGGHRVGRGPADAPAVRQLRRAYLGELLEERLTERSRIDRFSRLLVDYVFLALSAGGTRRLDAHLLGCPDCLGLLADLRREEETFRAADLGRDLLDLAPFVLAGTG